MDCAVLVALRTLNLSVRRYIDRAPVQKELLQLTGTAGWILGYLADHEHEDIYQRDIEKEFQMCRSAVSKMLAALETAGFIVRERVLHDDRLKKIILTPLARQYTEQIRDNNRKTEQALTAGFSPEELRTLHGFLSRMQQNMTDAT